MHVDGYLQAMGEDISMLYPATSAFANGVPA